MKPDVATAVRQITQTEIAPTRVNAQIVKEIITFLQKLVLSININSNSTEINYFFKFSQFTMKIVSLNCQSWTTAQNSVKSLALDYDLDLICLSETWEKDNRLVNFGSWPILSKPRNNNSGHGGVAVLCKPSDDFSLTDGLILKMQILKLSLQKLH